MSTDMETSAPADMAAPEPAPSDAAPTLTDSDNSMRAEMSRTFDRVQAEEGLSRVPNESAAASAKDYSVDETPETEPETQASEIKPPPSLNAKARELWNSVPKEMQQYISQREAEAHAKITELGSSARSAGEAAQQLDAVISRFPTAPRIPAPAMLEHLLAANHALETSPREALGWLANHYGVDLASLAQAPPRDPIAEARQQERSAMQAYLQQERQAMQAQFQYFQQSQYAAQEQQIARDVYSFAEGKDYWPAIEADVLHHIAGIKMVSPDLSAREILQRAHDRALKDHPDADKTTAQKKRAEAMKRADEARRLASLNVRSTSIGSFRNTPRGPLSGDAMVKVMSGIYDQIQARG